MKKFLKVLLTIALMGAIIAGAFFGMIWVACGGGGVFYLVVMILIAVLAAGRIFKYIWGWGRKVNVEFEKKYTGTDKVLFDYIKKAIESGQSVDEIRADLIEKGGWYEEEINRVINFINKKDKI